jgi:predicted HicB family RNase H-like nuclease
MAMSQKKTAGSSELRIRCDEALHQQLAEAARRSLRSMTREIIFRLQASLNEQRGRTQGTCRDRR